MQLFIFWLVVSMVPISRAGVEFPKFEKVPAYEKVPDVGQVPEAEKIPENVEKVFKMFRITPEDRVNMDTPQGAQKFLSRMSQSKEKLLKSWKTGSVDPDADFQAIHPDLAEKPRSVWQHIMFFLKTISGWNLYVARKERSATVDVMRQVFVYEKEVVESFKDETVSPAHFWDKVKGLCDRIVDASRHQILARKAGNGMVDLTSLPEYQEATNAHKRIQTYLSEAIEMQNKLSGK